VPVPGVRCRYRLSGAGSGAGAGAAASVAPAKKPLGTTLASDGAAREAAAPGLRTRPPRHHEGGQDDDASTGTRTSSSGAQEVVDVDMTPAGRLVITRVTTWTGQTPTTTIEVLDVSSGAHLCTIPVPNCADELVLAPSGKRAFLAPLFCRRDPISVIDIAACRFERNLPGFGPVAIAPDGKLAVGFLDRYGMDAALFDRPDVAERLRASALRYHLLFLDIETLAFDTLPLGDALPRYAMTRDGRMLLVDSAWYSSSLGRVRILDIARRELRDVSGPPLRLDQYALTPDSRRAFVISEAFRMDLSPANSLFDLDIGAAVATYVPLDFVPITVAITPDGETLLLKESSDSKVILLDVATREPEGALQL
jgi:hypothetical protein